MVALVFTVLYNKGGLPQQCKEVSDQPCVLATISPQGKSIWYPMIRRPGGLDLFNSPSSELKLGWFSPYSIHHTGYAIAVFILYVNLQHGHIATRLSIEDFTACNVCVESFEHRHRSAYKTIAEEWKCRPFSSRWLENRTVNSKLLWNFILICTRIWSV